MGVLSISPGSSPRLLSSSRFGLKDVSGLLRGCGTDSTCRRGGRDDNNSTENDGSDDRERQSGADRRISRRKIEAERFLVRRYKQQQDESKHRAAVPQNLPHHHLAQYSLLCDTRHFHWWNERGWRSQKKLETKAKVCARRGGREKDARVQGEDPLRGGAGWTWGGCQNQGEHEARDDEEQEQPDRVDEEDTYDQRGEGEEGEGRGGTAEESQQEAWQ